jgi:hypothetical protein
VTSAALARLEPRLLALMGARRRLIGLALMRILLGLAALEFYLSDYTHRQFLWGPGSYASWSSFVRTMPTWQYSLYELSASSWWFELVFHVSVLVAIAFTIWGGRVLTFLHAFLLWSIYLRNPGILEGGDNLARIVLLFMILCTTDAYLSPFAQRRRKRLEATSGRFTFLNALHNTAVTLIVFQVATVYLVAGMWKIAGKSWLNGSAMYYITRINEFHFSGPFSWLMRNAFATTAICYTTIVIEVGFPFLIASRRAWLRKLEVLLIEGMHAGIIVGMGLVPFGLIMLGADSACLRDDDYRSLVVYAQRAREWLSRSAPAEPSPALAPE